MIRHFLYNFKVSFFQFKYIFFLYHFFLLYIYGTYKYILWILFLFIRYIYEGKLLNVSLKGGGLLTSFLKDTILLHGNMQIFICKLHSEEFCANFLIRLNLKINVLNITFDLKTMQTRTYSLKMLSKNRKINVQIILIQPD